MIISDLDPIPSSPDHATGLVPRDYRACPVGYLPMARPFDLPVIPRSEWRDRLNALKGSQLSDLRNRGMWGQPIPSRDQNGKGYCWAHSSTSATLLVRAVESLPYADLSAYAVACVIKGFRDRGGWGAESLEFIADRGIPTSEFWPQQSMSRSNDNPKTWENAALHKVTEWMDLDPRDIDQLVSCLLVNMPVVVDYNWWSHSVCGMDLVDVDPNDLPDSLQIRIWNSWGDSWSENGTGILKGRRAVPDGQIAPRVIRASVA